ncbi:MAG TPA: hypothetical protein VGL93_27795 [Streptosporangiaceae bacterium]|jgi:hypothetical protein
MKTTTAPSARTTMAALRRWTLDPRPAYAAGALLIVGALIAAALTWPPAYAVLRIGAVGVLLLLRGAALHLLARRRARRAAGGLPVRGGSGLTGRP